MGMKISRRENVLPVGKRTEPAMSGMSGLSGMTEKNPMKEEFPRITGASLITVDVKLQLAGSLQNNKKPGSAPGFLFILLFLLLNHAHRETSRITQ
jgi:hypothetical protein